MPFVNHDQNLEKTNNQKLPLLLYSVFMLLPHCHFRDTVPIVADEAAS